MHDKSKAAEVSIELSGGEAFALAQSAQLVLELLGELTVPSALSSAQWALLEAIERDQPQAVFMPLVGRASCAA